MRKGGYYVNNTLLRASGQVNGWTSEQVNSKERQSNKGASGRGNKLIVKEDRVTRGRVDKKTSGRGNKLIAKKDKVTGEQG